jgi:putative salt-induced outer membrane protein YdiY
MTSRRLISHAVTTALFAASIAAAGPALAQTPPQPAPSPATPPPPPKIWTVSASAGWSFTQGNTDTSSVNAGYNIVYDPQTKNVIKSDGLYLRTKDHGEVSADRLGLNGRDEYKLTDRAYVFGQVQYLRDQFKDIDYLVAPTGGIGYKLIKMPNTELAVDGQRHAHADVRRAVQDERLRRRALHHRLESRGRFERAHAAEDRVARHLQAQTAVTDDQAERQRDPVRAGVQELTIGRQPAQRG